MGPEWVLMVTEEVLRILHHVSCSFRRVLILMVTDRVAGVK